MKTRLKISIIFLLLATVFSCDNNKKPKDSLDLTGMELDLKIEDLEFNKKIYSINDGIDNLNADIIEYIQADDITADTLNIIRKGDKLYINYPVEEIPEISDELSVNKESNSGLETITCKEKSCISDAVEKVISDGSKSVNVSFFKDDTQIIIKYYYFDI
ncbi:MAG: hypothetical protein CSA94_01115 [Bacteroidetes bacterium]|nr:MAG: hypothetical protein CSA94_01115 [Bacteroidota bacterium]